MVQNNLKGFRPEQNVTNSDKLELKLENFVFNDTAPPRPDKYKDPEHVWDSIDEKTKHINIINYDRTKKSNLFQIKSLEREFPDGILINIFEYPPNSIVSLKNLPKRLPYLESIGIFTPNFKSLQGFPEYIPRLKGFYITNTLITDLTPLPSYIPTLEKIRIGAFRPHVCQITSLTGFPRNLPILKELTLRNIPIKFLKFFPESLPGVEKIEISHTNITNLHHIPQNMPKLKELILTHNDLTTLKGMPDNLPKLVKIDIRNNSLSNLKHLPNNPGYHCMIYYQNNIIRTLHGVNSTFIKDVCFKAVKRMQLCPTGNALINNYHDLCESPERIRNLLFFYKKSSHELAQQYVSDSKSVNEGEIERLIWESNLDDRKLLENNVSPENLVLNQISQRLKIPLNLDFSLLK